MTASATDPAGPLRRLEPRHEFFIGIDSDGCAFDSMEIKHKECFIPNIIKHWHLQAVSKFARETAEFVNLYSQWRGTNRFPALLTTFDLLAEREEVISRGVRMPQVEALRQWVNTEEKLGNPALARQVEQTGDPVLRQALAWSEAVNDTVADLVHNVPPFPWLVRSLPKIVERADVVVVSATPGETLAREWAEHGIDRFARVIAGQEMGNKAEQIRLATEGRYGPGRVLMIGDAPGDLKAALVNRALFYPINPGGEDRSWQRFHDEVLDLFLAGRYAGQAEMEAVAEFETLLPMRPPWERR